MRSGKRVFIHHDGALGDTLLSLPCVRLIRRSTSCLHFAGRTDVAAFLKDAGIVDEMSSADSRVYSSLHTVTVDDGLAEVLSSYDAIYLFTVNGDSQIAANMRRIFPAAAIIKTIPPIGTIEHAAEFRLRQLGYCGEDKETENPIRIPRELTGWAAGVLEDCGYADGEAI